MNVKTNSCKIIILLLLCIVWNVNFISAQNPTNTILQDLDYTFQDLNTSKLNTGILMNKVISMSNIYKYNGVKDTTSSYKTLKQMYYELYNASFNHSNFKTLDSVVRYSRALYNKNQIPLLLVNYKYNVLKANAFTDGTISLVSGKFEDNTSITETPFETRTAFAFSTTLKNTHLNVINFYLDANLILTNSTLAISSIQIDFGDGLGAKKM